jgi:predicted metal-binding transcription factor (methanogenesis marker protein 9)
MADNTTIAQHFAYRTNIAGVEAEFCVKCGLVWPCDAARLCALLDGLVESAREVESVFLRLPASLSMRHVAALSALRAALAQAMETTDD